MSIFDVESAAHQSEPQPERAPTPMPEIDRALTTQLIVAWAGESGEDKRLGWWRSDLVSEFGGEDLFRRLLPSTWHWAVLQGARETARRADAELRRQDHNPDRIISLFNHGLELDERIDERLQSLKRSGITPHDALPELAIIRDGWNRDRFFAWVSNHGDASFTQAPLGRRLRGAPPTSLDERIRLLVAALAPAADRYPLPHFQKAP